MITTKIIKIKIFKNNIEYFKKFFKDIKLKDIIKIDPNVYPLQENSNIRIDVCCDICGEKRNITHQAYIKNFKSSDRKIYTCDKCSHIKAKETCIKKYGKTHYSKTDEYKVRFSETNMERYGKTHYSKTDEYKVRFSKTNMERFGVENPFQDIDKIKRSFIKKYGVDHPMKIKSIKIKIRKTMENNGHWVSLDKMSDFRLFKNKVLSKTRSNVKKMEWDGTDYYDGEFIGNYFNLSHIDDRSPTIDHKISIEYGFSNNISPEEIGSIENLCWTKRIINITKHIKNENDFILTDYYLNLNKI